MYWCAVCGRRAEIGRDLHCSEEGCPNLCHVGCLGDTAEYSCTDTPLLRERAGIPDHVTFSALEPARLQTPEPNEPPPRPEEEEDLRGASAEELRSQVLSLRRKLRSATEDNIWFSDIVDELPEKRRIFIEVLSIVDSLIARRASGCGVRRRTIACTATSDKIEKEWTNHINHSEAARVWWTSLPTTHRSEVRSEEVRQETRTSDTEQSLPPSPSSPPAQLPDLEPSPTAPTPVLPTSGQVGSQAVPLLASSSTTSASTEGDVQVTPPPSLAPSTPPSTQGGDNQRPPPNNPGHLAPATRQSSSRQTHHPAPPRQPANIHPLTQTGNQRRAQGRKQPPRRQPRVDQPAQVSQGRQDGVRGAVTGERREESDRQRTRCSRCRRQGHSVEQCPRLLSCGYCKGRYHTADTCKERLADRRYEDLIEAVRLGSQETLAVLKSAVCRQPPPHPQPPHPHQGLNTVWGPVTASFQAPAAQYYQQAHPLGARYLTPQELPGFSDATHRLREGSRAF